MVYKVGLVGTISVGKTALMTDVSGQLQKRGIRTVTLPEVATLADVRGFKINDNSKLEDQLWILHTQIANELFYGRDLNGKSRYDVMITDRGPDNYAFLERAHGHYQPAIDMLKHHMKMAPYHGLFLLPMINEEIHANGTRSESVSFRVEIDQGIRRFLEREDIPYTELPHLSSEDEYRDAWTKIIVNQTLKDLKKPEKLYIR